MQTIKRGDAGRTEPIAALPAEQARKLSCKTGRAFRRPLVDWKGSQRKAILGSLAMTLALAPLFLRLPTTRGNAMPIAFAPTRKHRTYTTRFRRAENPISEGGAWINGQAVGLDWANVRTKPGLAFGTEAGTIKYDGTTALLKGVWGPDQTAEATVHTVNQREDIFEEVELRLRSSLSAHKATGYEILFRCSKTDKAYTQIVRWNGPLGDFTYLNAAGNAQRGVGNGDVVRATIVGKVITAYINGEKVLQATDDTYTGGSPGMGFYLEGATGMNSDYGFTRFTASDL